jgi:dUTP pyrophosphatase
MIDLNFFDCCNDDVIPELPEVKTWFSACADVKARFHNPTVLIYTATNRRDHRMVVRQAELPDYFILYSGERACIPTGWIVLIPHGKQMKMVPRSGMALKTGITLINTPGTIDSDYTDELMLILHNTSDVQYRISEGDSIAQMEITDNNMPATKFHIRKNTNLIEAHKNTSNRDGGFGSTGK